MLLLNKKILNIYIIIYFNRLLRGNEIQEEGAKEIAQNFIHLKGLTKFHLNL